VTDPVGIGTAVVAYIEPHAGAARDFNRWYERDHFYAAAMAGPGMYAGARWVATRECKAVRPDKHLFGDPTRGSYLATYWVLPGMQTAWDEWVADQYAKLPPERLFGAREHMHTGVYRYHWEARTEDAPPPATALDHGFAGVIVVASIAPVGWLAEWARCTLANDMHLVLAFTSARTIMTTSEPIDHVIAFGFCRVDPLRVWRERVAPSLHTIPGLGFASPFLRTIPGTDVYTDQV
jgi:hypothetical protein